MPWLVGLLLSFLLSTTIWCRRVETNLEFESPILRSENPRFVGGFAFIGKMLLQVRLDR